MDGSPAVVFPLQKFGPKGIKPWNVAPAYGLAEHTLIVTGKGNWQARATFLYVDALKLRAERIVRVFTPEEAASRRPGEVQDVVSCGFAFEGVTGEPAATQPVYNSGACKSS